MDEEFMKRFRCLRRRSVSSGVFRAKLSRDVFFVQPGMKGLYKVLPGGHFESRAHVVISYRLTPKKSRHALKPVPHRGLAVQILERDVEEGRLSQGHSTLLRRVCGHCQCERLFHRMLERLVILIQIGEHTLASRS